MIKKCICIFLIVCVAFSTTVMALPYGAVQLEESSECTYTLESFIYERDLFERVNLEREKHGLKPLVWDYDLSNVALAHSVDMVTNSFFDHINLEGKTPGGRLRYNNIRFRFSAESLARGQKTADCVVMDWLESPSHRSVLLSESPTYVGIGVYNYYWTMHVRG